MKVAGAVGLAVLVCGAIAVSARAEPYAADQLNALAEDPALRGRDMIFLDAPAPDQSLFVTMPDGVRLAVSLYFPPSFDPATDKAAAIFEDSIYGRAEDAGTTPIALYGRAGYVVVIADARGFAASFGAQNGFNTPQQTEDEAGILDWIAAQPWSDGRVASVGHSVSATFADSMTATGNPHLKAAIIRAADFDQYAGNIFPGGVPNLGILALGADLMAWHAGGDCPTNLATCGELGFQPVAGDDDFTLLQAAIRDHRGDLSATAFDGVVFRDDLLGAEPIGGSGAIARIEGIRAAAVPARVPASWLDGLTAFSALTRFTMADAAPMEVVIGATTHPGGLDADPFSDVPFQPAVPSALEQAEGDVAFVGRVLAGEAIGRSVRYVVLGTDVWKTTDVWPPAGVTATTLMLSSGALAVEAPAASTEAYTVDPTTTSGLFNRWGAQRGKPIFYGDRRDLPGVRLSFDAPSFGEDRELVGMPELCIAMASDQPDGVVIATLEDVAPGGRVTYLTEGLLRLLHRRTAGTPCDPAPGARRSYDRADGAPVSPGEPMLVEIPLLPVAALVAKDHHLRLSLTGADAGWFDGLTGPTPATWSVMYGPTASRLTLPMRGWSVD